MNTKTKALNRKNNELDRRLNKGNNDAMTDMVCYLRVANISDYNQELVRHDLLQMVLSAQERGENIETVIGGDYRSFCDEVIAALPPKSFKERILDFIDTLLLCTSILGAIGIVFSKETIEFIRNAVTGQPLNFRISISIGSLLIYFIILTASFLIVRFICKNSFRKEKEQNQRKGRNFLIGGSVGGGVMAVFLLTWRLGGQTIFTVNILAAGLLVLGLYLCHILLQKYLAA
ncbi:conserved membrane protein of unknown function [Ruminococcaceae bacterium BL-6]|nr:conserved membrane protein of unknown function [Ruminococcaceae bacterium BL-6]